MKAIIWMFVVVLFMSSIIVLAYSLTYGSLTLVKNLANATDLNNPISNDVFSGFFSIDDVRYYDRVLVLNSDPINNVSYSSRCEINESEEILIVDLLLYNEKLPDLCEVFIDGSLQKEISIDLNSCFSSCEYNETVITNSIAVVDIYSNHKVRICCDGICHHTLINSVC